MGLVGGCQAGRDSYWVLTRMTMMNDKLLFVVSGCCAFYQLGLMRWCWGVVLACWGTSYS